MTSPDDTSRRLATAAKAVGPDRPGLAVSLASSDLSHSEIQSVGGFAQAMQVSVTRKLAVNSGAKMNLTAQEKNQLDGIGEVVDEDEEEEDSRSHFEKATDWLAGALSNTGNALIHNPVMDKVFEGFDWLGDAAHMPFRLLSDGLDQSNNDEIDAAMEAQGYNPSSTSSYLKFMFEEGESQYHDLSGARDVHTDELVDLAIQMQADPEQWFEDLTKLAGKDPDEAARLTELTNSQDFRDAYEAVDRRHISPGRDLARALTLGHEDSDAFTVLSGTLDAAYTVLTDPTLILGKAVKVARAMDAVTGATKASALRPSTQLAKGIDFIRGGRQRAGLIDPTDQAGIEALLATDATGRAVTKVGAGWERYLKDAADLRAARESGDATKQAGIYSAMESRYGVLMGLLPEINGQRVIADAGAASGFRLEGLTDAHLTTKGKPIETLDQLSEHLVSTAGLLRIRNGLAARETVVMPGKVSWWAERRAASKTHKAKVAERWINYARPLDLIPNEAEQKLLDAGVDSFEVRAGVAQHKLLNRSALLSIRAARAKFERVARRFQTQLPGVDRLNLDDPASAKVVENIARMYLNRGDAAKLASSYALATDLAERRAIVRGVLVQSFHASGLSRSEAGRNFMQKYIGDQAVLEKQQYGYDKTSEILTDRGKVQVALYPDQINRTVILPSMREMNFIAAKHAVAGWAGRKGLAHVHALTQSSGMDALIGRIKLGWITTAAGGLRNAIDEVANIAAYGLGKDALAARVAFSQATRDLRAERRAAAKERIALNQSLGRSAADDRIGTRLAEGLKSHEDAALEAEKARKAAAAVDDVASKLKQRVTDAHVSRAEAFTYRYRALDEFEQAKKAQLPEEQLAPLRERAQYWSDEVAKADGVVKQHEKGYANRAAEQDAVRQKFADRGYLSVDEANKQLVAAQKELHQAQLLQSAISHRIPQFLRWSADTVNDVFVATALGKAMSVFGKDWAITGERVKWANELVDREAGVTFSDGVFQAHHADTNLVNASDASAMDYHRAGLMARKYSFRSNGWGEVEADGGAGLDAWAKTLQLRFADTNSPAHAWAQTIHSLVRDKIPVHTEKVVTADPLITSVDQHAVQVGDTMVVRKAENGEYVTDARVIDRGEQVERRQVVGVKHEQVPNPKGRGKRDVWTYDLGNGDTAVIRRAASKKTGSWPHILERDPATSIEVETTFRAMTRDEWAEVLDAARESVLRRLDDDDMRHFVNSAEFFQWYKGEKIAKGDGELLDLAKQDYADRVSADLARALGREGGGIIKPLLDEIMGGHVPDRSWLAQLPKGERPSHAIGQLWAPYNPAMEPGQITRGMTGMLSKSYQKVVTDQINALSRNPLVTALYMRARENTKSYVDNLIAEGWDPAVADDIGRRIAAQHAEVEALKHIDNPNVSSQFSMLSRNVFAFVRAQEDWLKRWGRTIKDNPELIRKGQLLVHGGESVGFLEQDDKGELHFVYPNSGLLLGLLGGFFGAVNAPNGVRVPMQGELSSQLIFLNPSLDNPVALSGTPLLSLPWKAISHFVGPDHKLMTSSMDAIINGQLGAGREWWEQMLPSWANRIIGGVLPTEDMGSKYGAAIQSTVANQAAAGMYTDPQYQSSEGKAQLLHSLQVGIHNDLLATALFGFFAPAAPTYEGAAGLEAVEGFQGNEADWSAHVAGIRSLKDEARRIFSTLPFEEAKAYWMKVHPNESILAPTGAGSRSTVGADGANGAATIAAVQHMQHNPEFYDDYGGKGGAAAYLIPQGKAGTKNGEFSDVAYRAQFELGIRDHKTLDEYFDDIVTARGFAEYFDEKKKYDAEKAAAGNSRGLNRMAEEKWQETREAIIAANPLLSERLASYAQSNARDGNTVQSLYRMVNDTKPSTIKALGPNRAGIVAMLAAKEEYEGTVAALADRRGGAAMRRKNAAKTAYGEQIDQLAQQFPGLADLANAVFRSTS